jgi:alpha-glucoside transport system substrate-binding protein
VVAVAACTGDSDDPSRPVVEVFGGLVGEPGERFGKTLNEVAAGSGVELRYVGVTSFVEQLNDRLDQGDRPGIALVPQPGVLMDLADRGLVRPVPSDIAGRSALDYPSGLVDLVTIDGVPQAVWVTVDVKGLVWYRPSELAARDLDIPASLDELGELSETVRAADGGVAPWCVTMEAGASTGWVGTDWVEDYALRRLGPDGYDRWTSGQLPFDSPEITAVFDELDRVLRRPGAMAGGTRAVLTTPWERSADALMAGNPRCVLVRQADFLREELPSGTVIGPDGDVDFFPMPPAEAGEAAPLLLGGRLAVALSDAPGVADAMGLLAGPELARALNETGEHLSPHLGADPASISDETSRRLVDLVQSAPVVRFDGSDAMPAAVGTGTFWAGMRDFFAGEQVEAVLSTIQSGWSDARPTP